MHLGPILRALMRHRTRMVLIALEVALTLAIVVNCVNMILEERRVMQRPSGLPEESIFAILVSPFDFDPSDPEAVMADRWADVRVLEEVPGVIAATVTNAVPLSGGGSATGRKPEDFEGDSMTTPYFLVGESGLEVLDLELVAGRSFVPADFELPDDRRPLIVNRAWAETLFGTDDVIGKVVTEGSGENRNEIIGLVDQMASAWPQSSVWNQAVLWPDHVISPQSPYYYILARVDPDQVDLMAERIPEALMAHREDREILVGTLAETRSDTFSSSSRLVQSLSAVAILLVFVTCLGIAGLTSFSVTERVGQIGTRRALGATRGQIVAQFLVENWIVTTIGLAFGIVFAYALAWGLGEAADVPHLQFWQVALGAVALWIVGQLSSLAPALRGARVPPVVATRAA
ncbi:MAG: FtsX-like permease family protein [Acidobacteriota bacterium]